MFKLKNPSAFHGTVPIQCPYWSHCLHLLARKLMGNYPSLTELTLKARNHPFKETTMICQNFSSKSFEIWRWWTLRTLRSLHQILLKHLSVPMEETPRTDKSLQLVNFGGSDSWVEKNNYQKWKTESKVWTSLVILLKSHRSWLAQLVATLLLDHLFCMLASRYTTLIHKSLGVLCPFQGWLLHLGRL